MSHVRAFIEGMRSAFDFAPKQKIHKANFISDNNTRKVNVQIPNNHSACAWVAVGSYMGKVGHNYKLEHNISK